MKRGDRWLLRPNRFRVIALGASALLIFIGSADPPVPTPKPFVPKITTIADDIRFRAESATDEKMWSYFLGEAHARGIDTADWVFRKLVPLDDSPPAEPLGLVLVDRPTPSMPPRNGMEQPMALPLSFVEGALWLGHGETGEKRDRRGAFYEWLRGRLTDAALGTGFLALEEGRFSRANLGIHMFNDGGVARPDIVRKLEDDPRIERITFHPHDEEISGQVVVNFAEGATVAGVQLEKWSTVLYCECGWFIDVFVFSENMFEVQVALGRLINNSMDEAERAWKHPGARNRIELIPLGPERTMLVHDRSV